MFVRFYVFFFFNDTATTEIYTLSLHDALPIWRRAAPEPREQVLTVGVLSVGDADELVEDLLELGEIGRAHV